MKLKNKLVGLGIAALVSSGFCANRISVDAMQKSNNRCCSAGMITAEDKIKHLKEDFKKRGLDKCSDKPFFLVACNKGEQRGFFAKRSIVVMWSPEALKEALREKAEKIVGMEVIDKNGKKYRINKLIYGLTFDGYFLMDANCFTLFDIHDVVTQKNESLAKRAKKGLEDYIEKQGVTVDEGFDFDGLNEEYTVCLLDENGKPLVKDKASAMDIDEFHGEGNENLPSNLRKFSHGTQFDEVTVRNVVSGEYEPDGKTYKNGEMPPHKLIY